MEKGGLLTSQSIRGTRFQLVACCGAGKVIHGLMFSPALVEQSATAGTLASVCPGLQENMGDLIDGPQEHNGRRLLSSFPSNAGLHLTSTSHTSQLWFASL